MIGRSSSASISDHVRPSASFTSCSFADPGLLVRTSTNSPFRNVLAVSTNGWIVSSPSIGFTVIASGVTTSCKSVDRLLGQMAGRVRRRPSSRYRRA